MWLGTQLCLFHPHVHSADIGHRAARPYDRPVGLPVQSEREFGSMNEIWRSYDSIFFMIEMSPGFFRGTNTPPPFPSRDQQNRDHLTTEYASVEFLERLHQALPLWHKVNNLDCPPNIRWEDVSLRQEELLTIANFTDSQFQDYLKRIKLRLTSHKYGL